VDSSGWTALASCCQLLEAPARPSTGTSDYPSLREGHGPCDPYNTPGLEAQSLSTNRSPCFLHEVLAHRLSRLQFDRPFLMQHDNSAPALFLPARAVTLTENLWSNLFFTWPILCESYGRVKTRQRSMWVSRPLPSKRGLSGQFSMAVRTEVVETADSLHALSSGKGRTIDPCTAIDCLWAPRSPTMFGLWLTTILGKGPSTIRLTYIIPNITEIHMEIVAILCR
jgi:hypothetical protein